MPEHQDPRVLLLDTGNGAADILGALLPFPALSTLTDPAATPADADVLLALLDDAALAALPALRVHGLPVVLVAREPAVAALLAAIRGGVFEVVSWQDDVTGALAVALRRAAGEGNALRRLRTEHAQAARALAELREDEAAGHRVQQRILPPSPQDLG